ncbi:DUF1801 domain-containing protein [bacterium]|nr:MAG: DUF1801 domain-containing protein [bacterium]
MNPDISVYNQHQTELDRLICYRLAAIIDSELKEAESKIWHRHPVWFLDGNPVAGYSKLKSCIRLLFWSGQSFDEPELKNEGSFKAAEFRFTTIEQIDEKQLLSWLKKAREIQWDYKNIVKRRGLLIRLK